MAIAAIVLAVLCHVAYSPLGFNPTDDGFVLAYARRIIDGQLPHRDFITIRPAGSALLHLAEVAWGGDRTLLLSRLVVWLQFAGIALVWVRIATPRAATAGALLPLAFALSVNVFPAMTWHTVDGLMLCAAAWLLMRGRERGVGVDRCTAAGLLLAGTSAICKQSFLPMALAAPLLGGCWRRPRAWLLALAPALLYAAAIAIAGGGRDMMLQLAAQSNLVRAGVLPYAESRELWIGLGLSVTLRILERLATRSSASFALMTRSATAMAGLGVVTLAALGIGAPDFGASALRLFGFAMGLAMTPAASAASGDGRSLIAALLAAWCASISIGLAAPDLGSGALAVMVLIRTWTGFPRGLRVAYAIALAVVTVGATWTFATARLHHIYRERPAPELTARLDGIFPGAKGIRTHPRLAACLADLKSWTERLEDGSYAIIPDFAAYWIAARSPNTLSIDWPQDTELASPALAARVVHDLESRRGRVTVLVQKFELRPIGRKLGPLEPSSYRIVEHVTRGWSKSGESEFFAAYR